MELHAGYSNRKLQLLERATMTIILSGTAMPCSEVGKRRLLRHAKAHVVALKFTSKRDPFEEHACYWMWLQMKHLGLRGLICNAG
jgi:hypothetical protein